MKATILILILFVAVAALVMRGCNVKSTHHHHQHTKKAIKTVEKKSSTITVKWEE